MVHTVLDGSDTPKVTFGRQKPVGQYPTTGENTSTKYGVDQSGRVEAIMLVGSMACSVGQVGRPIASHGPQQWAWNHMKDELTPQQHVHSILNF
jgi:hypothetical protein